MKRNTDITIRSRRTLVLAVSAVLVALLDAGPASAHDLKAMVNLSVDPVKVEAWFDDDTPAQSARVTVVRDTGDEIAAGVTDERGTWSFAKPGPGKYLVVIESVGHRDVIRFTIPGAEEPESAATVETDMRLDQKLGLGIGLALLLGGSLAFVLLRLKKSKRETAL